MLSRYMASTYFLVAALQLVGPLAPVHAQDVIAMSWTSATTQAEWLTGLFATRPIRLSRPSANLNRVMLNHPFTDKLQRD